MLCVDICGLIRMANVQKKVKPTANVVDCIILLKFVFQSATNHRVQTKDMSHCPDKNISINLMFIMLHHQNLAKRMILAVMNIYTH